MVIGSLHATLVLHGIGSLKDKRAIVKSLVSRLRNRFNVSVSEVEHQDDHRCAVLGLVVVGNEGGFVHSQLDTVLSFMQRDGRFYLGQVDRELFTA